jgi:hypothetical protein
MSTVSFSFQTAGFSGLPVGTVVGYIQLSLTNPNLTVTTVQYPPATTGASVTITQTGNYTATIQAFTAANVPIGNQFSTTFALGIPSSISLVLPSGITPTVQP